MNHAFELNVLVSFIAGFYAAYRGLRWTGRREMSEFGATATAVLCFAGTYIGLSLLLFGLSDAGLHPVPLVWDRLVELLS